MIISRKLFARSDYEGLSERGKRFLKRERSDIAKKLVDDRKRSNWSVGQTGDIKFRNQLHELGLKDAAKRNKKAVNLIRGEDATYQMNKVGKSLKRLFKRVKV